MKTNELLQDLQRDTKLNGIMPVIGFGTWEITGKACTESVEDALNMGYTHIDTAQMYDNESEVGKGIKSSNISRDDIFLTTKIATHNLDPAKIEASFDESRKKLKTEYADLLLIHWPTPTMDLKSCLDKMKELQQRGKVKHLGVSNFNSSLFNEAIGIADVLNNQVKFTPFRFQESNLNLAKAKNKVITAYSPLERGSVANEDILKDIGAAYNKSASQVVLRWLIQLGDVSVIPKAQNEDHRRENLDIFDFQLSEEDMTKISSLGQ